MKSYKHFTSDERVRLVALLAINKSIAFIAKSLGKDRSTIYREIKRNRNEFGVYDHDEAKEKYEERRKACVRKPRIKPGTELYCFVIDKLKRPWSPEAIVAKWKQAHNESLSASTIYRSLKKGFLAGCSPYKNLRRRGKKYISNRSKFNTIHPEHLISERPEVIEKRLRIGDWEGDTVHGAPGKGGLITLVDRKSRYLLAKRIPNFSANTVYEGVIELLQGKEVKSITFDNGSEFARFADIEQTLNATVYFSDPHSPWQRGSNENMNGILRYYFPKGYDFKSLTDEELDEVVKSINARPRKCLGWRTPEEVVVAVGLTM